MMKANKKVMAALLAAMMTVSAGAAVVSADQAGVTPGNPVTGESTATTGWFAKNVKVQGTTKTVYYYKTAKNEYATGWRMIDGAWYYFGQLTANGTWNPSPRYENGVLVNPGKDFIPYAITDAKVSGLYDASSGFANSEFRFGKDGKMITGWYQVSNATDPVNGNVNNWEYYNTNGVKQTGWIKDGANWFFITNGTAKVTDANGRDISRAGTLLMNGTYKINNITYTFAANGVLVNEGQGWVKDGDKWYYILSDGSKFKGKAKMANGVYYLTDESWKLINGKYYLFDVDGTMRTGWVRAFNTKGQLQWYYMTSNGDCVMNNWIQNVNGDWYLTNASGEMVTGWAVRGGKTYFLGDGTTFGLGLGVMATGTVKYGNNTYTFDANGALVALNGQTVDPGVIPTV